MELRCTACHAYDEHTLVRLDGPGGFAELKVPKGEATPVDGAVVELSWTLRDGASPVLAEEPTGAGEQPADLAPVAPVEGTDGNGSPVSS